MASSFLSSLLLFSAVLSVLPKPGMSHSAVALGAQAVAEVQANQLADAIRDLRSVVELARTAGDRPAEAAYLFLLALAELNHQDVTESLRDAEAAIKVSHAAGISDLEASARALRAETLGKLGRYGEAKADLEAATTLVRSADKPGTLPVLLLLGQVDMELGRYGQAAADFEQALSLQHKLGTEEGREALLSGLGLALSKQGRFADALPPLKDALRIVEARNDEKEEASLLAALGNLSVGTGDYPTARSYFGRAEIIYKKLNDLPSLWLVRINLADIDATEGQTSKHEEVYEEAVKVFRQVNDNPKLARALTVLGILASRNGHNEQALRSHQEALAIQRQAGDRGGEAQSLRNVAMTEFELGRLEQALEHLEQTLAAYQEGGNLEGEAEVLLDSGHCYADLGRIEEGISRLDKALKIARTIADKDLEARSLCYIAEMLFASAHFAEAFLKIDEARRIAQMGAEPITNLAILGARGLVLLGLKQPRESLETLAQARQLSQELGRPCEEAQLLGVAGSAHLVAQQPAEARAAFEKAREVQRAANCFASREMNFFALGATYESLGEGELSVEAYEQAIEIIENAMEDIRTDDLLAGLVGQAALVYPRLIQRAVQSGQPELAFTLAEKDRGRALLRQLGDRRIIFHQGVETDLIAQEQELRSRLEALKQQVRDERGKPLAKQDQTLLTHLAEELDQDRRRYETLLTRLKLSNPEYASLVHASPLAIAATQQLLDSETSLLEYFVLEREVLVWVVEHDSYRLVRLAIRQEDLYANIEVLRNGMALREPQDKLAAALYQNLFAPVAAYVRHSNLLIVPHGALQLMPFAALLDPSGHPLVESYSLAFLPSASVLPFILAKYKPVAGPMLVLGNPDGSLPYAETEARAVAQLFGTEPLLGSRATETALRERASQAGILHIAAHTTVDLARPLFSHMTLARDAQNDGELEVHEIFGLDLSRATLVVLAACNTGAGKVTADDDASGLTRAFLYAGAPAVVTTLWRVDDEASAELMKIFYGHLQRGDSTASALRQAQLELRQKKEWRLPYYWASFSLTGVSARQPGEVGAKPRISPQR